MTRHFCISITPLDDLFHGKGDDDEPEWPPSPMRLFQALVAGSRTGCRDADWSQAKAEAFHWLERRDPPLIVGPEAKLAAAYTLFVPNNDADKKFDRQDRLTSKVVRPHRIVGGGSGAAVGPTLHYLWAIPDDEWATARPHAELLCYEARHLMALGWGIDQAVASGRLLTDAAAEALPGRRWRAWRTHRPGQRAARVPIDGSLEGLKWAYASFVSRIDGTRFNPSDKFKQFDSLIYLSADALPPRPYGVFELPEGVAFRQEATACVAAMLRSLACRCAKADSHRFPGGPEKYVAGHGPQSPDGRFVNESWPRFSYLPLPTIGHEHADGMIRRVLIAEPFDGEGTHARWAQQRLRNQVLRDCDGNERGVLLDLWRRGSKGMLDLYVAKSRRWSTVTPVILPGFDDNGWVRGIPARNQSKPTKPERLFVKALEQAGIGPEAVQSFTLRKAPFFPGSQHPNCYRRPDYLDSQKNRRFSAWHVHLCFHCEMPGPIAVGAGRHVGLGLFASANDAT